MRHDLILNRENSMLVVIDFQQRLLGAFDEPEKLVQACVNMVRFAKILTLPILWTEQYPRGLGPTVDEIAAELDGLQPVEKLTFSCFGEPRFVESLSQSAASQLIVCGIETHICVEQSVLDAIACAYDVHVIADACGSRKESDHNAGLRKMEFGGAVVTCAEMALYEMLGRSDSKEFREALKIVK
jgi:nicotinamidase-related amidase